MFQVELDGILAEIAGVVERHGSNGCGRTPLCDAQLRPPWDAQQIERRLPRGIGGERSRRQRKSGGVLGRGRGLLMNRCDAGECQGGGQRSPKLFRLERDRARGSIQLALQPVDLGAKLVLAFATLLQFGVHNRPALARPHSLDPLCRHAGFRMSDAVGQQVLDPGLEDGGH